jgi:hypothetical protein
MSSNLLNIHDNALRLQQPHIPSRIPFSSPINDDQISQRSFESRRTASSSDLASSPNSSQNPFGDTESGNTSGQDEFHLERYSESSAWTGKESAKYRPQSTSKDAEKGRDMSSRKTEKPDLNVVTDFTRPTKYKVGKVPTINQVPARRPKAGTNDNLKISESRTSIRKVGIQGRFASSGFVNLNDLEGLRKKKTRMNRPKAKKAVEKWGPSSYKALQEAEEDQSDAEGNEAISEQRLQGLFRKEGSKPSRREQDNVPRFLRAPNQDTKEPSPTARSIVIGISIPENEVAAHKPSDEASSALTLQTPATPTIVVTPADATVGWSQSENRGTSRRPASSIYSQAARVVYQQEADAPPMPLLLDFPRRFPPSSLVRTRRSVDTWEADSPSNERPLSVETIIDEDTTHQTETWPLSAECKDEIIPSSGATGRPRSRGWWNLMLSPMLSRAGTNGTTKTTSSAEETPALPCLSIITAKELGRDEGTTTSAISSDTPKRAGLDNVRNGTWSNWTQWEHDREEAPVARRLSGSSNEAEPQIAQDDESNSHHQAIADAPAKKAGLAAEYYQACAFDQLNSLPYFECVNHDCLNALPKLGGSTQAVMLPVDSNIPLGSRAAVSNDKQLIGPATPPAETRIRSDSESTMIEDDPIELSPNVRKADARPIMKASQPQRRDASLKNDLDEKDEPKQIGSAAEDGVAAASSSATPPAYFAPQSKPSIPRYVAIMPPTRQPVPLSPGPLSPEAQRAMNPNGGVPMSQIRQPAPTFVNFNSAYPTDLPPRPGATCVSLSDIENPTEVRRKAEVRRRQQEQEEALAQRAGGLWRGRGCFPKRGCHGRGGSAGRTRRRWYIIIATSFVLMITLIVVLATQLTRKGDRTPVQSQWLNLTGYPPMPTGISTIAQPDIARAATACVQPSSLWSCALPREDQARDSPNDPDQPNFRLEIRFRNGTVNANGTVPASSTIDRRKRASPDRALLRRQSDPFTNSLFEPNPAPPGLSEQIFLGNTTDNTSFPFSGEATPFFITFLTSDPSVPNAFNHTSQPARRQVRRQTGFSPGSLPAPAVLPDGKAAPANLLPTNPLPYSQPVMLYNRGLDTEHYGFYTYFDKSIFIRTTAQFNSSSSSTNNQQTDDSDNVNGGSPKEKADLRCTWAQTRFLVQIWTNLNFAGQLLPSANGTRTSSGPADGRQGGNSEAKKPSATDFSRPGSLPYPVSITLDRHGGDSAKKGVYCYGMDGQQKIVVSEKKLVAELRNAGGTLLNAAPGIFSKAAGDAGFDPKAGGIDGGTGGCGCEWRNWIRNGKR